MLERYSTVQAAHGAIAKDLDEKKELIKNLYNKLQLEKQVCLVAYAVTKSMSFTILHMMNSQSKIHLEYGRRMNSSNLTS